VPPIVDAHSDLLSELSFRAREENPFGRRWLPKLLRGGVALQVCAVFAAHRSDAELIRREAIAQLDALDDALRGSARARPVLRKSDARLDGDVGLLAALEGAEPLGGSFEAFELFWARGVRMLGLTWNSQNAFAAGIDAPHEGLTREGRKLIERLGERGCVLDLAHASARTLREALTLVQPGGVVVSHTACRAIVDHARNLSDDELKAVAAAGGVVAILADASFIDRRGASVDRVVDHVEHAATVMGHEHVGLGGDFLRQVVRSGAYDDSRAKTYARKLLPSRLPEIPGLRGPEDYGVLVDRLQARGFRDQMLAGVLGANLLRVFRATLPS
jgi:membrane dipeptidase